jgi:hypothetical protein
MPRGFKNVRFAGSNVNTYHLLDNCYYCSVAALLGASVEEFFKQVEIMQERGGASPEATRALFREAGVNDIACAAFTDPQDAYDFIKAFPDEESVGLAYYRGDGSGHMIVATRDNGHINNWVNQGIKCVDYQHEPPRVAGFPPEPTLVHYVVFYRRS